jgi:Leucine-rich repeat (LRR) protein
VPARTHARLRPLRLRSLLMLGLPSMVLTIVALDFGMGGHPLMGLLERPAGLSAENLREIAEVKKLGGEAHFLRREPGIFGRFGGRDLIDIGIHGKPFDDDSLAQLIKTYGNHLSGLEVSNTGITDRGLRHLAGLPHLTDLRIGNIDPRHLLPGDPLPLNKITDAGLVHLKTLTKLQGLNLVGLPITDAGLDALKDLPNLGGLYLDRTRVTGPGLGRLKSLPSLAVLYLDGSALSDAGLSHLKGATNLQVLSLAGVPLSGLGLAHLKALPKLDRLNIQGCGVTVEDHDAFLVARPSVKLSKTAE